ncbi:MAG: peptidylprolyl isomerase [Nitrospiraceae bacterium]|nr:MAG: peptidylprolyl isomerase [Nitrospiraceae bacterium]
MRKKDNTQFFPVVMTLMALVMYLMSTSISAFAMESKEDSATVKEGNKIVAKVNGQPIYEDALTPFVRKEIKKYKKYSVQRDTSKIEKHLQKKALEKVIARDLLYQESQKIDIEGIEEKIAERMKKAKEKYESNEEYASYLKTRGLTEKDVKESTRRSIAVDEYLKMKGIREPEVPEEEIRAYYNRHKRSFKREETIMASHILIMVKEEAKPEEREEARAKAESIRKGILAGEDFAEMAKKHSTDSRASQGGDLGYINRKYMPSEFDEVAFALKESEVSEVVHTKHGYHIIKVTEHIPEGITPYEEVRDFIGKFLKGELARKNYLTHVKELKSKAKIEILLDES